MLEFVDAAVALPGRGVVFRDVALTAQAGRVTALVGPGGGGTTTLLKLAARALPGGALFSGKVLLDGQDLLAAAPGDVSSACLVVSGSLPDPRSVASAFVDLGVEPADFGLGDRGADPVEALPPDLRAKFWVAQLEGGRNVPLVFVDQPTAPLDNRWRARLGRALRARAGSGAHVLWAEHQLDQVWEYADDVAEPARATVSLTDWQPATVREPTLQTLARVLGLPPAGARSSAQIAEAGPAAVAVRRGGRRPRSAGIVLEPGDLGVVGDVAVELVPGESVGVVATSGRAEPVARRAAARLRGTRVPSILPGGLTPSEVCRQWDRAYGTTTLGSLPATMRRHCPLSSHSAGEVASLRLLLARSTERAVWLPQPQLGLDQAAQISTQRELAAGSAGIRIITTRDVEFLVRACSRVLVVDDDRLVAFGTPRAVLRWLPDAPLTARALPGAAPLRLGDVLDSLAEGEVR